MPTAPVPNVSRSFSGTLGPKTVVGPQTNPMSSGRNTSSPADVFPSLGASRSGSTSETPIHDISEFSLLTSECLQNDEVVLSHLVLSLHAPADDFYPSSVTITCGDVSVTPFPGIKVMLSRNQSPITKYLERFHSKKVESKISVPKLVVKSA